MIEWRLIQSNHDNRRTAQFNSQLQTPKEIGSIVTKLSYIEICQLLDHLPKENPLLISAVITGIPMEYFSQLLIDYPSFFKQYAEYEITQHKLSLLELQMKQELQSIKDTLDHLFKCISALAQSQGITTFSDEISQLKDRLKYIESPIQALIETVWLSERPDLIQLASNLKEQMTHLQIAIVALEKTLIQHMQSIFDQEDTADAMEGLGSLGFLYVEDYQAILQSLEETAPLSQSILIERLRHYLHQSHLFTIKDLKVNEIFTKERLLEFLKTQVIP